MYTIIPSEPAPLVTSAAEYLRIVPTGVLFGCEIVVCGQEPEEFIDPRFLRPIPLIRDLAAELRGRP